MRWIESYGITTDLLLSLFLLLEPSATGPSIRNRSDCRYGHGPLPMGPGDRLGDRSGGPADRVRRRGIRTLPIPGRPIPCPAFVHGTARRPAAFDGTGRRLYAVDSDQHRIMAFDSGPNALEFATLAQSDDADLKPVGLAVSGDGRYLLLADSATRCGSGIRHGFRESGEYHPAGFYPVPF